MAWLTHGEDAPGYGHGKEWILIPSMILRLVIRISNVRNLDMLYRDNVSVSKQTERKIG